MNADLIWLATYSFILSIIALISYFIARAVERKLSKAGKRSSLLWGAVTFIICNFILLFVIGLVIMMNLKFSR